MIKRILVLCLQLQWLNIHISYGSSPPPSNSITIDANNNGQNLKISLQDKNVVLPLARKKTSTLLFKIRHYFDNQDIVKGNISGYLIPSRDAHYSEYPAPWDERRSFISGFNGSAGDALVTLTKALMWTDSRYFVQAVAQMDENWTLMKVGVPGTPTIGEWINREMDRGSVIGADPKLVPMEEWLKLEKQLASAGNKLVPVDINLVDLIWEARPQMILNPVKEWLPEFAGKPTAEKLADIRKILEKERVQYIVFSALDETSWLLNWRGTDLPYQPVFYSYVVVGKTCLDVFVHPRKATEASLQALYALSKQEKTAKFHDYNAICSFVDQLVDKIPEDGKIWLSKYASYFVGRHVPEHKRIIKLTPIATMRTVKNPVEIKGMKNCHIRDAVAVCQFFGWLDKALHAGEPITEACASKKIKDLRSKLPHFAGSNFPAFSASGSHSAFITYNPEASTVQKQLSLKEIFLFDSGGLYLDGTTDITRTVHFGTPTLFQKEIYTKVLKSQIHLINTVFPNKLVGHVIDGFVKQVLTNQGLTNLHGTNHAINSYLRIHDGPAGICWKGFPEEPGLLENMFASIEPGYYHENEFGIRLENVVRVVNASVKYQLWEKGFLSFDEITMVPFQQRMIDQSLLTAAEIQYINYFHKECRQKVGDYMKSIGIPDTDPGYIWLMKETEPM